MKKILLSLAVIAIATTVVIGATRAYFSDTETSTGNTFSTGTIDINVNGGTWEASDPYTLTDMKPGYTDYVNFTINNTGSNPANIWKKLTGMVTTGADNEAELRDAIVYDLSVKVYRVNDTAPFWFQTIYADTDLKTLNDVYGSMTTEDKGVFLGMIPEGGRMEVTQSYHMAETAGNDYQSASMTFDMGLYAEQLINVVTMVHKTGADWDKIDYSSNASAVLTYKARDDSFRYDLAVNGLTASTNYVVVSGTNPYNNSGNDNVELASFTTDGSGNYSVAGVVTDFNKDLTNAKVWTIPASHWNGTTMTNWVGASYLFETGLIEYIDPIH
ncbi:MAG: TasA family protein [Candidatus Paceibacterota bacterium]|jgi:predicted ribosomally synthesized peptide with SipW-like signal peptide